MSGAFDRTSKTLVAVGVVAVIIAALHTKASPDVGVPPDKYWAAKTLQPPAYNIVFGGDSRAMHGFSPRVFADKFPQLRCYNFAFSACANSSMYVQWLAKRLVRKNEKRIIILGITANSLTPNANIDNNFLSHIHTNRLDLYVDWIFGDVIAFFNPFTLNEIIKHFKPSYRGSKEEIDSAIIRYDRDGWAELTPVHPNLEESLPLYRKDFQNNVASEELIGQLLETVRELTRQGVVMIGIRPPTTIALRNLEDELSGWNEANFAKRFEAAG